MREIQSSPRERQEGDKSEQGDDARVRDGQGQGDEHNEPNEAERPE